MDDKDLYAGLVRLHILYHADEGPIFGLAIIEELRRHGYDLSPGTLYPMLHGLERKGYLRSRHDSAGKRARRVYRITARGRAALRDAREKVKELFGELLEGK
ncbi:MAG: PadR family transcriptional regulator [Alphaproteobacteria bacterium]|jgi:DNA-binding PadR family transcriptional regulator|nr:PadR family transcriptional regulator [Alphaproteobacteria bacterium]